VPSNIGIQLKDKAEAIMPEIQISLCCQGCWTIGRGSLRSPYLSAQASKNSEFWSACVDSIRFNFGIQPQDRFNFYRGRKIHLPKLCLAVLTANRSLLKIRYFSIYTCIHAEILWAFISQNYEQFWYSRFSLYPQGRWPKNLKFRDH
jgi:hypothetical protein